MSDARRAFVVDAADNRLGEVALKLLRLGIDLHYSADLAEAWLLAEDVAKDVRLLILNPRVPAEKIAALEERLCSLSPDIARTLMVIGRQPDDATRARLREAGVELALWEPYDEVELRAALQAAMAPHSNPNSRKHPRIVTTLLARASMGLLRTDAIVSSLSLGGAFLEAPDLVPGLGPGGHDHHRDVGALLVEAQQPQGLPTVHLLHHDVEQDQVRTLDVGLDQAVGTVGRGHHLVAALLQHQLQKVEHVGLVVDGENRLLAQP